MWTFLCYDPSGANGGIHPWYNSLPEEVKASVDAVLLLLANESGQLADLPYYKELRGHCLGLDEVIVDTDDDCHFRILAFKGPGRHDCTLLMGFEKQTNADYGSNCASAMWRKNGVVKNASRARECNFP